MVSRRLKLEQKLNLKLIMTDEEALMLEFLESNIEQLKTYLEPFSLVLDRERGSETVGDTLVDEETSLSRYMEKLLPFALFSDEEEKIADFLIYNLDDKGKLLVTLDEVSNMFDVDEAKLMEIIERLREIGPPGLFEGKVTGFGRPSPYVLPDIIVKYNAGKFEVVTPPIELSPQTPYNVLKAIQLRSETLVSVGKIVVKENMEFFLGERDYPKRLREKFIASKIGRNPSTVSRAVKNKYIASPRGVFKMEIFVGKGSVHPRVLMGLIRRIVEENGMIPDREIANIISKMGFKVSRRTINKYRNILGIPASRRRRKS